MEYAPDYGQILPRKAGDLSIPGEDGLLARVTDLDDGSTVLLVHHPVHGVVSRQWIDDRSEAAAFAALDGALPVAEKTLREFRHNALDNLEMAATNTQERYQALARAGHRRLARPDDRVFSALVRDEVVLPALHEMNAYRRQDGEPPLDLDAALVAAFQRSMEDEAVKIARDAAAYGPGHAAHPAHAARGAPAPPPPPTRAPAARPEPAPRRGTPRAGAAGGPRGKSRTVSLPPDVAEVLRRATVDNMAVHLPPERLDPALYQRVAKALGAVGAAWDRRADAHVFKRVDARDAFLAMLGRGAYTVTQDLGFFETPPALAASVASLAGAAPGRRILEPSAGRGAIVRALLDRGADVTAVEYDEGRAAELRAAFPNVRVIRGDFLALSPRDIGAPFDGVAMNPPFALADQPFADVQHVEHALSMVRKGAPVAAVMSPGARDRDTALHRRFHRRVEAAHGTWRDVPAGAFKDAGTSIKTVLLSLKS